MSGAFHQLPPGNPRSSCHMQFPIGCHLRRQMTGAIQRHALLKKLPTNTESEKQKKQQRFTEKASCNITSPPAFRLTNKRKKNLFSSLIACVCLKIQQRRSEQWRSRERGTSALASNNCSCTSCCSSRRRRL